MWVSKLLVPCL